MIKAEVINDLKSSEIIYVSGSLDSVAAKVLPPEEATSDALIFVSKAPQLEAAISAKASIIVAHRSLTLPEKSSSTLFHANSVQTAMATILPLFDGKMNRFTQTEKIHPTAYIHETAVLEKNVSVGPFVVVGERAHLAEGVTIGAHSVIETYASIGAHTLIHPQVFIGAHCSVGADCEIHPHTTIGADGFSFVPNKEKRHQKIPQLGNVVIGDRVEIGAGCAIDRAALTSTKIGNGSKFDNLCHIAHNCVIGEDNVFTAGFKMAGSSTIGNNCMFGGDTAVADHVSICSNVIVAGRSGVANDITEPGAYGGYPLEPLKDSLKTLTNLKYLTKIRKDVAKVIRHLGLNAD